jgi:hypothetical protein
MSPACHRARPGRRELRGLESLAAPPGQRANLASAGLLVASDDARFLTGAYVPVSGGVMP